MKNKMSIEKKLAISLLILAILTPIGLWLPEKFEAGSAWGEWSLEEVSKDIGYTPKGMEKVSNIWKALIPDYSFSNTENKTVIILSYIASAIIGISLSILILILLGKIISKKRG